MNDGEDKQSIIAGIARQMLDDMANKTGKAVQQTIRIVFGKSQIVTLRFSAVTVARDKTTLYLAPIDAETLIQALRPADVKTNGTRPTLTLKHEELPK